MKSLLLLLFIVLSLSAKAADSYVVGDKLYVWAKKGLNIRTTPSLKGKKIGALSFGTKLNIVEKTNEKLTLIGLEGKDNFFLRGNWVKVQAGDKIGYVFDVYLLNLNPKLIKQNTKLIQHKIGGDPEEKIYESKINDAITISWNEYNYSLWYKVIFNGWSIEEAFVFLNVEFDMINKEDCKIHHYTTERLYFSGNDLWEWTIEKKGQNVIISSNA